MFELAAAIRNSGFFTAFRESALFYPFILSTHLVCLAVFGGMVFATNLRLLNVAFRTVPATEMVSTLRPWKRFGLVVMVGCGIMLAGSRATDYYPNTVFRTKLFLLMLLAIHAYVFRSAYREGLLESDGAISRRAKLAAALSLILWISVAVAGRWIAYWDNPHAIF